jgi:carboxyl-terminal processing protease
MVEEATFTMTSRTRLLAVLISAPIIAFTVIGGFLGGVLARAEEPYAQLKVFADVVQLIMSNYVERPNMDRVMRGAMRGLAEGLDSDSAHLTPQQVRQVESGEAVGPADVGITLTHQYYLRVVAARDDSPAARAGVRPGDFVRLIDSRPTRDMSAFEGQRLLHGAAGSKVKITIIRGGSLTEPHQIELTREVPPAVDVRSKMQGETVGYVRIISLRRRAAEQLRTQIASLTKSGAARLIIDVRNSASGDLTEGIAAARLFVPSGTLGIRESRAAGQTKIAAEKGDGAITLPITLLVDSGTSGPAEVFAAALAGNKRAELVGERTVGRTGVQELVKLPDGSGLWITSSRYLTPSGTPLLQAKGLEPDVPVGQPEGEFGAQAPPDSILQRALERPTTRKGL